MLLFCVFGIVRAGGMLSSPDPTASHSRLWTLLIFVAPVFVATVIAFMLKDKNISAVFYGVIVLAVAGAWRSTFPASASMRASPARASEPKCFII